MTSETTAAARETYGLWQALHRPAGGWAMWLGAIVAAGLLLTQTSCAGEENMASISVWATGDGVRVNPETGKYLEDRPDIHADYPGGDYRGRNAVWDAAAGRVALRSARNEFVAFQLVVESDKPASGLAVRLDELRGPGGARISGRNVALLKAWYVKVVQKSTGYDKTSLGPAWYPDPLIPGPTGKPLKFDLPDARNAIGPTQRNQTVWVDIYVPRDRKAAPPGEYTGELKVSWPGGGRTIDVALQVWDFALPEEFHCRGDIWNDSIRSMPEEMEVQYYQMAHRHRFHPGVPRYRPDLTVDGTKVTIDWKAYDRQIKKFLNGTAFTDAYGYWGPGVGVGVDHMMLPFDCERGEDLARAWPIVKGEGGKTPDYEAVWVEAARQVKAHFDADPTLAKTEKIVFIDSFDESYREDAYQEMIYYCKLLRRGMGEGWFRYRVDGSYSWDAMEVLEPYVDLWLCHTIGYDQKTVQHFREKGVEPWFYGPQVYEQRKNSGCGSNTFTDLDLNTCRCLGWMAWKYRSGYCSWEFDAFWDDHNKEYDPNKAWVQGINYRYKTNEFNGSGLLIYRGDFIGRPGPVPSIRLKAHRRGFQDYEYFWLLKQAGRGEQADGLVNSVIYGMPYGIASVENIEIWKNDPEAWQAARLQAGQMLDRSARK